MCQSPDDEIAFQGKEQRGHVDIFICFDGRLVLLSSMYKNVIFN